MMTDFLTAVCNDDQPQRKTKIFKQDYYDFPSATCDCGHSIRCHRDHHSHGSGPCEMCACGEFYSPNDIVVEAGGLVTGLGLDGDGVVVGFNDDDTVQVRLLNGAVHTIAWLDVWAIEHEDQIGYPPEWPIIARAIKHASKWRCEHCDHPHDPASGHTLTVHHLNGVKSDCRYENLVALCQRCHLHIQAVYLPGQLPLFEPYPWAVKRGLM